MRQNEGFDLWVHHIAPAAARKNSVMPSAFGFQMFLACHRYAAANCVNRLGLARARDVVQFAFNREQGGGFNILRAHAFDFSIHTAHVPGAIHQAELLEHDFDGLQVIVSVHVQHGVVFVVKLAVRLGACVVTLDQVFEVIVMAVGVVARVHRHKARMLQKARVDAPAGTRKLSRHAVDHIVFKPAVAFFHGQVVDCSG